MKKSDKKQNDFFDHKIQVRYPDFDTQFFVNHSKICTYIESAYIAFFVDFLKTKWDYGKMPILLKSASTEYYKPITVRSAPLCRVRVKTVKSKGVHIEVLVLEETNKSHIYAKAERILIHVNLDTITPIVFSRNIINCLNNMCNTTKK